MAGPRELGKGRVFYTALGDWEGAWKDDRYRRHLLGGIEWTSRRHLHAGRNHRVLPGVRLKA